MRLVVTKLHRELDQVDCQQAEEMLHAYLDRELSEQEASMVRRHLDACPNCRARFRFSDKLRRLIARAAQSESSPPGLRQRIELRLQRQ